MAKNKMNKLGKWSFILGIGLAIFAGILNTVITGGTGALLLAVFGLIVGLLNVQEKEALNFLVAAIALMVLGTTGVDQITLFNIGTYFKVIVRNIAIFVAPAAAIVSLKLVFDLAKD